MPKHYHLTYGRDAKPGPDLSVTYDSRFEACRFAEVWFEGDACRKCHFAMKQDLRAHNAKAGVWFRFRHDCPDDRCDPGVDYISIQPCTKTACA